MDVILDVDPGVDDALAILLALESPELNVRALTVVSGNVPLETGTENALSILAFHGSDEVPVYSGADRPVQGDAIHALEVHGESGLGYSDLPKSGRSAAGAAVGFLAQSLRQDPGQLMVIAVGPLTNLALAERSHPGVLGCAKEIIVMGGSVVEPGNASPCAEFNFLADPQAAREVIAVAPRLTVVPLDVTHQVGIESSEIEKVRRASASPVSEFFCNAADVVVEFGRANGGYEGVHLHDPTAVIYAVDSTLFEIAELCLDVETDGELTRGQLVADLREGVRPEMLMGTHHRVTMGVQSKAVLDLFRERVLQG